MRGTPCGSEDAHCTVGIIPAHAGNTPGRISFLTQARGSSPRMRGTRRGLGRFQTGSGIIPAHAGNTCVVFYFLLFFGIIPAHAGNTCCRSPNSSPVRDHPRACGEHFVAIVSVCVCAGSSPRMRGTLPRDVTELETGGIIPAHAGNTPRRARRGCRRRDHPRACGEHCIMTQEEHVGLGSSPRMRGTHQGG